MSVTFKTKEGKTYHLNREEFLKYMEILYNVAQRKKDYRLNGQAAKEIVLTELREEKAN
jgi:hypothetical protein